jgi:hypothetical protein
VLGLSRREVLGAVGAIALGVLSNYAYDALRDSSLPFSDVVALAIWPLAMILLTAVVVSVVRSSSSAQPSGSTLAPVPASNAAPHSPEVDAARDRLEELEQKDRREKVITLLGFLRDEILAATNNYV